MYGALAGFVFIMPIYLQTKMGYTAFQAGLSLLPVSILMLLLSSKMGALSAKYGPRYFLTVGPFLAAISILSLINYGPGDNFYTFLIPRTLIFGLGMATLVAPLTTTVMSSVDERGSGIASGINNAVTRIAGLIVVAMLGLAGAGNTYRFSLALCAILAAAAGVISYFIIRNPAKQSA
jgi:predicted MFS family arabinose efflux permease